MVKINPFKSEKFLQLLLVIFFAAFVLQAGFFHISGVDTGFHIRTGELVWQSGRIPSQNTFSSICPEHPWLLHQWLPATAIYLTWARAGIAGLIAGKALLGACIFLAVYFLSRREARTPQAVFLSFWVLTLAVILARPRLLVRPYLVSALLLAVVFFADRKHYRSRLWHYAALPLIMALWSNIHMGVIVGFQLLFLLRAGGWAEWFLSRRKDPQSQTLPPPIRETAALFGSLLFSGLLVSLINPNGMSVLAAPVQFYLDPYWKMTIDELMPPVGATRLLLIAFVAATSALLVAHRRSADFGLLFVFLFFSWLAFRTQRAVLFFAIAASPLLSRVLSSHFTAWSSRSPMRHFIALPACWLLLTTLFLVPDNTFSYGVGINRQYHPTDIFSFMLRHVPRQRIYNDMQYGGPILLYLYPDFRPFVDGRGEAYAMEFWHHTYEPVSQGRGSLEYFDKNDLSGALIWNPSATDRPLARQLLDSDEWSLVACNDFTMLFLRDTESNSALLKTHEIRHFDPTLAEFSITPSNLTSCMAEASRCLKVSPESRYWMTAYARTLLLAAHYVEALELYRDLSGRGAASYAHQKDMAYCMYMTGDKSGAEELFTELTNSPEADGYPWYMLAMIVLERNQSSLALEYIGEALRKEPDNEAFAALRLGLQDSK